MGAKRLINCNGFFARIALAAAKQATINHINIGNFSN